VHVPDPTLHTPADDQRLWRYSDLGKYLSLLDRGTLHFARADTFGDHFEMAYPVRDIGAAKLRVGEWIRDGVLPRGPLLRYLARASGQDAAVFATLDEDELGRTFLRHGNRALYMSCWHANDSESAAMWDLYLQGGAGVAVQTTFGRLREALDGPSGDVMVFLRAVRYLDYRTESWGEPTLFSPAFHKRRSFEHEREVRAVVVRPTYEDLRTGRADREGTPSGRGVAVPVAVDTLVEKVVVSPGAPGWFVDLVASLSHRLGLERVPLVSDLAGEPTF